MADKKEEPKPDDEKKIPVFTVIKNGSILKNIFLLDNPPAFHNLNSTGGRSFQEVEETLVIGRHPDCNITLEHPSISRYHLRIHSKPSSHSLSIIDLSSVHGTWVSGKKIEPGILVELKEGDTVRLGGSSRVYKLHWVPLNRAYDLDHPFFPPLDKSVYCEEENHKDENCSCAETVETQLPDDDLEGLDLSMKKMSPLAPLVPDYLKSTNCDEGEVQNKTQLSKGQEECEISCSKHLEIDLVLPETGSLPLLEEENENAQPPVRFGITSEIENVESHCTKELLNLPNVWSTRGMVASVQIQTSKSGAQSAAVDVRTDVEPLNQDIENEAVSKDLLVGPDGNEVGTFTPDKENFTQHSHLVQSFKKMDSLEEIKQSNSSRLSPLKNAVGHCMNDVKEIITTSDKENLENMQHESTFRTLFSSADGNEEKDVFTPDKENFSPKTLMRRYMKQIDKAEEIKHSECVRLSSSKNVFGDISQEEHLLRSSDRGTRTPNVLQERKAREPASKKKENLGSEMTVKRLPFQLLPVISVSSTKTNASVLSTSTRSCNSVNYARTRDHQNTVGGEFKMWTLVVDTNCLLHKESRKALQLLQGVKGTQLIIPGVVIRELDCMKLRASLFRRTKEVSLALQWIEDCMVNTKWWIHVQSSVEEGMLIAPTPRALTVARRTDEWGGLPFSSAQIATPTTDDHILEYALFLRRIMNDRQLVLLSSDISLKIKSMAEGVLCETAEEFRKSLVNPFSERFLWADSSPRGATWSCEDDTVLMEKYYHCPLKKPESLKGLKLILLHNSQYKTNHFNQLKI